MTPAQAQILWNDVEDVIDVSVRPGWRESDGRHVAALEFRLAKGWKTYWRSPGAAGIAPQFDWGGSRNVSGLSLHWPVPSIGQTAGAQTLGYYDSLVLPVVVQPKRLDAPVTLRARLMIGVCADICLPARLRISADLPVPGAPDPVIKAALDSRPAQGRGAVRCTLRPTQNGVALSTEIPMARALGNTEVVAVELANAQGRLWITDTQTRRSGQALRTETEFMRPGKAPVSLDRSALRFTVVGARGAVEYWGCTR